MPLGSSNTFRGSQLDACHKSGRETEKPSERMLAREAWGASVSSTWDETMRARGTKEDADSHRRGGVVARYRHVQNDSMECHGLAGRAQLAASRMRHTRIIALKHPNFFSFLFCRPAGLGFGLGLVWE